MTFRSRFGQFVSPLPSKLNDWFVRWKNSTGQAGVSKEEELINEGHFAKDGQDSKEKESEDKDSEGQDSEGQDSEGQDSEGQYSEAQDSERPDSEGQDSEGQDYEEQDSEEQHSEDEKSGGSNSEEGSVTDDAQGSVPNPDPVSSLAPTSPPASFTPNNAVSSTTSTPAPASVSNPASSLAARPAESAIYDEKLDFKHRPQNDANALSINKETEWIEVKKQVKSKQLTAIPNQTQSAGKRKNTFTTKGTKVLHCCSNGMSCTVQDCDLVHGVFESKQESRFQRQKKKGTSQQWSGLVACALALKGVCIICFFCCFLCRSTDSVFVSVVLFLVVLCALRRWQMQLSSLHLYSTAFFHSNRGDQRCHQTCGKSQKKCLPFAVGDSCTARANLKARKAVHEEQRNRTERARLQTSTELAESQGHSNEIELGTLDGGAVRRGDSHYVASEKKLYH